MQPWWWRVDWLLVFAACGVVGVGLPYLYSAAPALFGRQVLWLAIGCGAAIFFAAFDYQRILRHAYTAYGICLLLLIVVLFCPERNGARCWIAIPGTGQVLQPAEFMKIALILTLARHLRHRETQSTWSGLFLPFLQTFIPMLLLLKQPDLGTSVLFPPVLFAVLFASGARGRHLLAVATSGLLAAVPMWHFVMKEYQRKRILAFLDPEQYEAREAYQLLMSLIAIGSGGLFGQGLGNGRMNELDLLPEKHNDFIFGVIAEEGGFTVAAALLGLHCLLVLEAFHIAHDAREPGGRLIATGCAAMLGAQIALNVGVVTALLPTTGITLPLVSYGGSSMLATCAMLGLLLNVAARQPFEIARESFRGPQGDQA